MTELDLAKEWLNYAQNDLISAKHLFNDLYPKQTEIACFHSQQCAEKSLKGYLVSKSIKPPFTHDLIELNALCETQDIIFSTIKLPCESLNPYGSKVRYPNELAVDDAIAKMAIEKAQIIYDFCVEKIIKTDSEEKTV